MDGPDNAQSLFGTWIRVTADSCAEKYPQTLTFSTGTYRGARGPDQGMVLWDAGIYRLEGAGTLVVSTASDELVSYGISLSSDRFEIVDADGCRVIYRRA